MACNSMVFGAGDWFWKIMNYSQLLKKIEQYKNKYNIKKIKKPSKFARFLVFCTSAKKGENLGIL